MHALRIKGFATVDVVAEMTGLGSSEVDDHLQALLSGGHVMFREKRGLWQLTPDGRTVHADLLAADLD